MSWLHQHSSGMQYLCSKHFQNRAGLIWSFSNLHCVPVKLQLTTRKFFKFRVPVQRRLHRHPTVHALCRHHLQDRPRPRRMHELRGRQVLCCCCEHLHRLPRRHLLHSRLCVHKLSRFQHLTFCFHKHKQLRVQQWLRCIHGGEIRYVWLFFLSSISMQCRVHWTCRQLHSLCRW